MKRPLLTILILSAATSLISAQELGLLGSPGEPAEAAPETAAQKTSLDFVERSNRVIAKITNAERSVDPFGFPMDPLNAVNDLGLSDAQIAEIEEGPALDSSALQTAVETLPISGVYPDRQAVVIGARSFRRGEQFGMKLQELTIRLQLEGIKGSEIRFRDMDTRELAVFDFNPTPPEFEPITKSGKRPAGEGIVPMNKLFIIN